LTLIFAAAGSTPAQETPKPAPTAKPTMPLPGKPFPKIIPTPKVFARVGPSGVTEKSIAVDGRVNVTIPCITQGDVKINGWERDEVRVFIKGGSPVSFGVKQKSQKSDKPVWIWLSSFSKEGDMPAVRSDCIWGDEIQIDAPMGAEITMKGRETNTVVDSVRKATVTSAGGDLSFRNITEGVSAKTYEGDLLVENSQGPMSLETQSGNIVAFGAAPGDVGDTFRAKTSGGTISLQKLEYRQTEANSISGSVFFDGSILGGGSYTFNTTNGSIRLSIPSDTACFVNATYGPGGLNSDLPLKATNVDVSPGPVKTIRGTLGTGGDAVVKLTTNSGTILIRKQ
jgi:hypothetical protein